VPDNKEKQSAKKKGESKEGRRTQSDEEIVGSWTSRAQEVRKWKNLIHLGLGFWSLL
jgi:hypothetical protein